MFLILVLNLIFTTSYAADSYYCHGAKGTKGNLEISLDGMTISISGKYQDKNNLHILSIYCEGNQGRSVSIFTRINLEKSESCSKNKILIPVSIKNNSRGLVTLISDDDNEYFYCLK